jgi:hypothetical protein
MTCLSKIVFVELLKYAAKLEFFGFICIKQGRIAMILYVLLCRYF